MVDHSTESCVELQQLREESGFNARISEVRKASSRRTGVGLEEIVGTTVWSYSFLDYVQLRNWAM